MQRWGKAGGSPPIKRAEEGRSSGGAARAPCLILQPWPDLNYRFLPKAMPPPVAPNFNVVGTICFFKKNVLEINIEIGGVGVNAKMESVVKNWPWWLFYNSDN